MPVDFDNLADVEAEDGEGDGRPFPTLADRWADGLLDKALDPDKVLLQVEDAGLGRWLDRTLGGGLQPGNIVGLVSAGAGAGKTAFVHQLADGLAKHNAEAVAGAAGSGRRATVWPVVLVTEMRAEDLTIRTLSREAEVPGALLRAPKSWAGRQYEPGPDGRIPARDGKELNAGQVAIERAREAAARFRPAADFLTIADRTTPLGEYPVSTLERQALRAADRWEERGADVPGVVLVIDPLHRLGAQTEDTAELGAVLETVLNITHRNGFVTLFTSDTTKNAVELRTETASSTAATLEQRAELAFRGSYQLLHIPDFAFALRALNPEREEEAGAIPAEYFERERGGSPAWATVYADVVTPKLRWGKPGELPGFWYDRAIFRFEPIDRATAHGAAVAGRFSSGKGRGGGLKKLTGTG